MKKYRVTFSIVYDVPETEAASREEAEELAQAWFFENDPTFDIIETEEIEEEHQ